MAEFDLEVYLKLTGAEKLIKVGDKPSLNLLDTLVTHHVKSIGYQNYDMLVTRRECDLSPAALFERMLVNGRGGMCFESAELIHHVLRRFGFDAKLVANWALMGGPVDHTEAPTDHHTVVVHLDGSKYLVDCGFGFNSLRRPIEFSFEEDQEVTVTPAEKYRLECNEDHFTLNIWLKEAWAPMYKFRRPLAYMSSEESVPNYRKFLNFPQLVLIRDSILKIGRVTESGRVGFTCSFDSKKLSGVPPYTMLHSDNHQVPQPKIVNYEQFSSTASKYLNFQLNNDHFKTD